MESRCWKIATVVGVLAYVVVVAKSAAAHPTVNPGPTLAPPSAAFSTSGDYATDVLGDPWDFTNLEDVPPIPIVGSENSFGISLGNGQTHRRCSQRLDASSWCAPGGRRFHGAVTACRSRSTQRSTTSFSVGLTLSPGPRHRRALRHRIRRDEHRVQVPRPRRAESAARLRPHPTGLSSDRASGRERSSGSSSPSAAATTALIDST